MNTLRSVWMSDNKLNIRIQLPAEAPRTAKSRRTFSISTKLGIPAKDFADSLRQLADEIDKTVATETQSLTADLRPGWQG